MLFVVSFHVVNTHSRADLEGSSPAEDKIISRTKMITRYYNKASKFVSAFRALPFSMNKVFMCFTPQKVFYF